MLEAQNSAVLCQHRDRKPYRRQRSVRRDQECLNARRYGQVGSYVTGVKMVLQTDKCLEVTESAQPELMKKVRCSYGTFGIVYEVTYKIRPLLPLAVYHETFGLQEFIARQPELKARNESMMYYIFPFVDKITVEFRRYNPSATGEPDHCAWGLRNHFWGSAGPKFGHDVEKNIPTPSIRYGIIDAFGATWRFQLENLVKGDYTIPGDQIIHYPAQSDDSRYTFSLFAFPEEEYPDSNHPVLPICERLLQAKGLSFKSLVCWLLDQAGPASASVVLIQRGCDDHRPGIDGEPRLG